MAANVETLVAIDIDTSRASTSVDAFAKSLESVGAASASVASAASEADSAIDGIGNASASAAASGQKMSEFVDGFRGNLGGLAGELANASRQGTDLGGVLQGAIGGAIAGGVMSAISAATQAIQGLASAMVDLGKQALMAAAESEQAGARLRGALALQGLGDETARQFEIIASGLEATTKHSDEAIVGIQTLGLNLGVAARDIPQFTQAAVGLSSALGVDLDTAARQLAQTLDGDIGRLGELVPALENVSIEGRKAGQAFDVVAARFAGLAEDETQTLQGALDDVKKSWGMMLEEVGKSIIADVEIRNGLAATADVIRGLTPAVVALVHGVADFAKWVWEAKDALLAVFAPILLVTDKLFGLSEGFELAMESAQMAGQASREVARIEASVAAEAAGANAAERAEHAERIERNEKLKEKIKSISEAIEERAGTERNAAQSAADAEASQRKALEEQIAGIQDRAIATAHVIAETGTVTATLDEQAGVYDKLRQQAESDMATIRQLWIEGKLGPQEAAAEILLVRDAIAEVTAAEQAMADQSAVIRAAMQEASGDEGVGDAELGATDDTSAEAIAERVQANQDAWEAEAGFRAEIMDLRARMIEQEYSEAEVENAVAEAKARHAHAESAAMKANVAAMASYQKSIQNKIQMRQATIASASSLLQEAAAGTLSAQSLLKAGLEYLAGWAGKKSIAAFASAAEQAAIYTASHGTDAAAAAAAAQFTHTGTMWGVLAAGAGVAAGAVGAGGGGKGGGGKGGRDDADIDSPFGGRPSTRDSEFGRTRESVEDGQRGPQVTVIFNGSHHVGDMEELGRRFAPVIQNAIGDQGGRQGSRRL